MILDKQVLNTNSKLSDVMLTYCFINKLFLLNVIIVKLLGFEDVTLQQMPGFLKTQNTTNLQWAALRIVVCLACLWLLPMAS